MYLRISRDPTGLKAGVKRQREDCLALAEKRGWNVVDVLTDNDVSAWRGKARPAYRRMLAMIATHQVDGVVVWHLDRLVRLPKELEEFFEVCQEAGVTNLASVTGDIDLGTYDGQFMARILGAVAKKESDDKSRRIRRKAREIAEAGRVGGGGTRPFGYDDDRVTVREDERPLVVEAADRVLAGESVRGIITDWSRRGIATVTGAEWRSTTLRRMLLSPRIAGMREHQGEVLGEAEWPAIIDRETHERLRVVLTSPARLKCVPGTARRYLLTGFLCCGRCGAMLVARPKDDKQRAHVCAAGADFSGCGKISTLAEPIEDLVAEAIFQRLDTPALTDALHDDGNDGEQARLLAGIRADEDALTRLAADHYVERIISRPEFISARAALESRIEDTRRALAARSRHATLVSVPSGADAARRAWAERDLEWRRALVGALIEKVIVNPAVRGRNTFDSSRFDITWRA